jgi:hypothetical protein
MSEQKGTCPKCSKQCWENPAKGVWHCFKCNSGGILYSRTAPPTTVTKTWHKDLNPLSECLPVDEFCKKYPNLERNQILAWELYGKIYMSPLDKTVLKPLVKSNTPLTLIPGNCLLKRDPTLIIVEDFISGYCVHNAGFSVLVLNGTSLQDPKLLLGFQEIIIWLDGDPPGLRAAKKLQQHYGYRCIISEKDPKAYTYNEILELINS